MEPDLPVATEIAEPLLEIVIAESASIEIQHRHEIYNRNARELSILLMITTAIAFFSIFSIFLTI